jgi:hypothetical protein
MCVCVCVYIYIYIHTHTRIRRAFLRYVGIFAVWYIVPKAFIHTYIHTHIQTHILKNTGQYVAGRLELHMCAAWFRAGQASHIHTYIHTYIHTHTLSHTQTQVNMLLDALNCICVPLGFELDRLSWGNCTGLATDRSVLYTDAYTPCSGDVSVIYVYMCVCVYIYIYIVVVCMYTCMDIRAMCTIYVHITLHALVQDYIQIQTGVAIVCMHTCMDIHMRCVRFMYTNTYNITCTRAGVHTNPNGGHIAVDNVFLATFYHLFGAADKDRERD